MGAETIKRKLAAVLHADVKNYSRMMGDKEEETLRTLSTYLKIIFKYIEEYRGRVVGTAGDAVLAEFASAVDSVNCAVEIQRDLAERNAELPDDRKMLFRIGVNLGDVMEDGEQIYGDGVNIAARVEALADGGGISVSGSAYDQIYNKLDLQFEYQGEQQVKNISNPVRVYKVLTVPGSAAHRVVKAKVQVERKWKGKALVLTIFLAVGLAIVLIWDHYFPYPTQLQKREQQQQSVKDSGNEQLKKNVIPGKQNLSLQIKRSIAVLPFDNMSSDPEQEHFVDGMTDDLITDLSKIRDLFVVARNSVFTYKGKPTNIQEIGNNLGVRYVLEGSVRRGGQKIRINAQLIDASTGMHIWAERYDGNINDIFELQDRITAKIVSALSIKLSDNEQLYLSSRGTTNIEAYDSYLQGLGYLIQWNKENVSRAIPLLSHAIELDPNYGLAYASLGSIYWHAPAGWVGMSMGDSRNLALKYLDKSMKNPSSQSYILSAVIKTFLRSYNEAISDAETALSLSPSDPLIHGTVARVLIFAGRPKDAIYHTDFEMRRNPTVAYASLRKLGLANFCLGQYEKSIDFFERSLVHNPGVDDTYLLLAVSYALHGNEEKARESLNLFVKKSGWRHTLREISFFYPFKDRDVVERFANGLLKAGITGNGYYKIYEENRLNEKQLDKLISGVDNDNYKVEGNKICVKKWKWLSGCYPVYRNPDGEAKGNNEYLIVSGSGFVPFSRLLSSQDKPQISSYMKWEHDSDGVGEAGLFRRENSPSFSIRYPTDYKIMNRMPLQIFLAAQNYGIPNFSIVVRKYDGDVQERLKENAELNRKIHNRIGTDVGITSNNPLPPETYGKDYPAQEFTINWKYQGAYSFSTYANVIAKDGYFIQLSFTNFSNVEKDQILSEAHKIFRTMNLGNKSG